MNEQAISTFPEAALINALRVHGIRHLTIMESAAGYDVPDETTLILQLARHADPRVREALIPLFLRHPELAESVPSLVQRLDQSSGDCLRHLYTAAVYLQRLWLSILEMYLGRVPLLPDHFGQSYYGLPGPDDRFGEAGLRGLGARYEAMTGMDWLSVYGTAMDLFLWQLAMEQVVHG